MGKLLRLVVHFIVSAHDFGFCLSAPPTLPRTSLFDRTSQSATIGSGLSPPQSGARFSGAMAAPLTFFGIPKDNLATLPNRGFAASSVIEGFLIIQIAFPDSISKRLLSYTTNRLR